MWPSGFSLPKVLFFILRYYVFIHHAFGLYCASPLSSPALWLGSLTLAQDMELKWAAPTNCHRWFIVNASKQNVSLLFGTEK